MLQRLATALHVLEAERALKSCSVRLVLYWSPNSHDVDVAFAVVRRILELERKGKLNAVECQVYTQLWKEAMRVSRRGSFEYDSSNKFQRYLKRANAGEERQVGNTLRTYDLRQRKIA
jgi:hypothetical protein